MSALLWIVAGIAFLLHRVIRKRKAKDLHKIPLGPKSVPILGHTYIVKGMKVHSFFTTPDGEEHRRVRRHMMKFFNADNIATTVGSLADQTGYAITAISAACTPGATLAPKGDAPADMGIVTADVNSAGVQVNAYDFAAYNVLSVVCRVFLEKDAMALTDILHSTMEQASSVAAHPAMYNLLTMGLFPGHKQYRRNWEALHAFYSDLMDEIYARPAPGENSTALWAALRNAFPDALTDKEQYEGALANLSIMVFAGYESTANAVRHTLAALAIDQPSQEALAKELRDAGLLAAGAKFTSQKLAGLSVLDAVCHESLRYFPPAPSGGIRLLGQDTQISGYTVPKGSVVFLPPYAMHHNPLVWGPDAHLWQPDRWLQASSVAAVKKAPDGNSRFLPFLDGPSNCIGQHLALVELKVMVAMVVARLHVTLDPSMAHLRTVEDYAETGNTRLTLGAEGATLLRMRPRTA